MTDDDLAALIYQYTGLSPQQFPDEYAEVYRLAHAVMTAAVESMDPETWKELPSPAGKEGT